MRAVILGFVLMMVAVAAYRVANPYHQTMFWRFVRSWLPVALVIAGLIYGYLVVVMNVDFKFL
jgi:hypothetical protein